MCIEFKLKNSTFAKTNLRSTFNFRMVEMNFGGKVTIYYNKKTFISETKVHLYHSKVKGGPQISFRKSTILQFKLYTHLIVFTHLLIYKP